MDEAQVQAILVDAAVAAAMAAAIPGPAGPAPLAYTAFDATLIVDDEEDFWKGPTSGDEGADDDASIVRIQQPKGGTRPS
jgi:hypothetical protein